MNDLTNKNSKKWECDWNGAVAFQLRYFRALPLRKKVAIVEEMCEVAQFFKAKLTKRQMDKKQKES